MAFDRAVAVVNVPRIRGDHVGQDSGRCGKTESRSQHRSRSRTPGLLAEGSRDPARACRRTGDRRAEAIQYTPFRLRDNARRQVFIPQAGCPFSGAEDHLPRFSYTTAAPHDGRLPRKPRQIRRAAMPGSRLTTNFSDGILSDTKEQNQTHSNPAKPQDVLMNSIWIEEHQLATALQRNEAYWRGELEEYRCCCG